MIKAAAYNCESLLNPELFEQVYGMISPFRQAHVDAAKNMKAKCERLGASHLLEKMLWENHFPRPYDYDFSPTGKPLLVEPEGLYFSLSHSDYMAVCAICDDPVGIDIERMRRCDFNLAERFFTRYDNEFLKCQPENELNHKFTEIWTFKEAVSKMLDRPLVQVLQWIDFDVYCECNKDDIYWTKQGFEFRDYYITLCYEQERSQVQMGLFEPLDGKYY